MKAVCILGSPRVNGNTHTIVTEMMRALEEAGMQTTTYQLSSLDIGYCCGCKACYTTGRCTQPDDVQRIVADMLDAQLVIVASPSYWGDVTGQMKVFIDRCTPYGNTNPARPSMPHTTKGVAIAIRAGGNKAENSKLVGTMEHFLGHLDIPLAAQFTVEGIDFSEDLLARPQVVADAYQFGRELSQLSIQDWLTAATLQ